MDDLERWLPIPGHEGKYEVSNQYRVRSLGRVTIHGQHGVSRTLQPKLLKTSVNNGYLVAYLCRDGSRKARMFYVEKAVLLLFPNLINPDSLPGEEWRDIRGYEGLYQVSNLGRIFSVDRIIDDGQGKNRYIRSRIRVPGSESNGYPKVELAKEGINTTALLHRLVAEAFVPNPLNLPFVHHIDENKTNPKSDNLEWVTRAANVQDWFDRRRVVVSTDTINTIADALASGKSPAEILASLPRRRKKS